MKEHAPIPKPSTMAPANNPNNISMPAMNMLFHADPNIVAVIPGAIADAFRREVFAADGNDWFDRNDAACSSIGELTDGN